jgi:hypothetical protein
LKPGDLNVAVIISGYPACGKTTLAVARLRALMAAGPAYVVCHDPRRDLTRKAPDVTRRHANEADADRALADPTTATGLHCLDVADPMRVMLYAHGVARRAAPLGVPTYLYLDECSALRGMSPSYLDPVVGELYLGRRHELIGYVMATQRLQILHPAILENASELLIFRTKRSSQLRRLDELGLEDIHPGVLDVIANLPDHHHLSIDPNG